MAFVEPTPHRERAGSIQLMEYREENGNVAEIRPIDRREPVR